ncbi:MFS transporter [Streptomyces sp. NPDC002536]
MRRYDCSAHPARRALAAVFALHGALSGSLATRLPWIQEHLGLGPGRLGLALVFPALGAACAMPLAARVSHRFGSRAALRGLLVLLCAAFALPALSPGPAVLCAALAGYGAAAGMVDVVMNALGVEVEDRLGRSIMSGLHGMWSTGTLAGSALGTLAAHSGTDARVHLGLTSAALALLGSAVCRWVPDLRGGTDPAQDPPPRFALPPRSALAIGAVGFCAVFAEGAGLDWSAVYLRRELGAAPDLAAACTTAFTCTMAAARLAGDTVVRRFGPVTAVRAGGAVAAAGGALVVTAGGPVAATAGFALIGLGVAVVVPLVFAAAGRSGPQPARAIAGVATIVYTSGLVAPAAVGQIAAATSLSVSFGLVTVLAAGLVLAAGALRPAGDAPRAVERARRTRSTARGGGP